MNCRACVIQVIKEPCCFVNQEMLNHSTISKAHESLRIITHILKGEHVLLKPTLYRTSVSRHTGFENSTRGHLLA